MTTPRDHQAAAQWGYAMAVRSMAAIANHSKGTATVESVVRALLANLSAEHEREVLLAWPKLMRDETRGRPAGRKRKGKAKCPK